MDGSQQDAREDTKLVIDGDHVADNKVEGDEQKSLDTEQGVVLGIRQSSCFDRLPEDIKRRREEFLREQEANLKQGEGSDDPVAEEQVTARFASRLERVKQMTKTNSKKKFSKQNFQAILVCIVLFVAYVGYNEIFKPDETTLSLEELQARLPMPIDNTTALVKAYEQDSGIYIEFKKKASEYEGLSDADAKARKDVFLSRAHSLCRNELFNKYVRSGKALHVSLNADDGRAVQTITVDQCPSDENAR